ncbi:MAG: RNA-binding protein [Methanohalobium sp.]|uniref:RNA-binding protein n=1 Tax=Methanohalobium sp. TaxID=2837493 RepID=UPI00397B1B76
MKIRSRVQLRKSTKNKLLNNLVSTFGDEIKKLSDSKFECVKTDEYSIIMVDDRPLLFFTDDDIFPTVSGALEIDLNSKNVFVDSGAVKFVSNGADIMSPGIVKSDPNIKEGDLVIIKEENHGKPLAIGRALVDGSNMVGNSGKAVKSIHYVGDELWNISI